MTKKLFSTLLAATLVLSLCFSFLACAHNADTADKYPYLTYEIDEESNTIAITGYDAKTIPDDLVLPEEINGVAVTKISKNAFKDCKTITSVIVPDSVTLIAGGVFDGCSSLKKATLPDDLQIIPGNLFSGCSMLEEVNIPETVTKIMSGAFGECISLSHIVLPDSLETIGMWAFETCPNLSVVIPSNVKLETEAFSIGSLDDAYKGSASIIVDDTIFPAYHALLGMTIYASFKETPDSWFFEDAIAEGENMRASWTSSDGHKVFYGCTLKANDNGEKYVYSVSAEKYEYTKFGKTYTYYSIPHKAYDTNAPYRDDYAFLGWTTTEGKTTPDYTNVKTISVWENGTFNGTAFAGEIADSDEEETIPLGTTLYTVWQKLPD